MTEPTPTPSTDLMRYTGAPPSTLSSVEFAADAWKLAQRIADTEFVPKGLRKRPEAVLAAMLTGHEAGVGPMASLSKIHVVDGRPGMAAELMRALVLRDGHELWIEESSRTVCRVGGRRSGSERETRVEWTLDDAKTAGLAGKDNWRKYPRAMLAARATAELCRMVFPDVLAGISYTVEELADGDFGDVLDVPVPEDLTDEGRAVAAAAKPPAKRTARARKAATRGSTAPAKTEPDPEPKAAGEVPPLPGEEVDGAPAGDPDDEIVDGEIVEDDDAPADDDGPVGDDDYEGPDQRVEREARAYTGPQVIAIRLAELEITDRADRLRIVGAILDRTLETTKDLDSTETKIVLDYLNADDLDVDALRRLGLDDADLEPLEPPSPGAATESPGPRPTDDPSRDVASWSDAAWRSFLAERGVKVTEVIKEAQRLAREDGDRGPATLADLAGPDTGAALKALLVGFVEDLAAQRAGS